MKKPASRNISSKCDSDYSDTYSGITARIGK